MITWKIENFNGSDWVVCLIGSKKKLLPLLRDMKANGVKTEYRIRKVKPEHLEGWHPGPPAPSRMVTFAVGRRPGPSANPRP